MKRFTWLIALALSGCVNIDVEAPVKNYFVLNDAGQPACQAAPGKAVLLIDVLNPAAFYNAPNLAYGRNMESRGYYQYAQWADRPAQRIGFLLRDRLRGACLYRQVALSGEGMTGQLQLSIKLVDLYHDIESEPSQARIALDAQLIRRGTAELLAHQTFTAAVPVPSHDARGAAAGFNRALPMLFDRLGGWLARQPRD